MHLCQPEALLSLTVRIFVAALDVGVKGVRGFALDHLVHFLRAHLVLIRIEINLVQNPVFVGGKLGLDNLCGFLRADVTEGCGREALFKRVRMEGLGVADGKNWIQAELDSLPGAG